MLNLYNTLTRKKQEFTPISDNEVRMYSCGPTVYDYAHIGNLRAFLFADLVKRALLHDGYNVQQIMNITDVGHLTGDRDMGEDKLQKAASREKKTAWEIASYYTDAFLKDIADLNILNADKFPKATDHINEMIELVKTLEEKGFTYKTSDGIYFDTSKLDDYGKLARLDKEGLEEGARVEKNPEKQNPTDFALWKFSNPEEKRQMEWKSPWGVGFPGWHVECSAMSVKYLGQPFDIHTGGIDHVPIHHTNEIAQSEAAAGKPLANFWLHNEHLLISDKKIAKSEGDTITLEEVKKKNYSPLAFRYFVLQGHYRSKLNFTWQAMDSAQNTLDHLYAKAAEAGEPGIGCAEYEKDFFAKINDDLNTPEALSVMWEMLRSDYPAEAKLQSLLEFDKILGLSVEQIWQESKQVPDEIQRLAQEREELRKQKKFDEADSLRDKIEKSGYMVRDTESGPFVRKSI